MNDHPEGLKRRYTIRSLPEEVKLTFEAKVRAHEEGPLAYSQCPRCLSGRSLSAEFTECPRCCEHTTAIKGYLRQSNGVCKGQLMCLKCGTRRDLFRGESAFIYDLCLRDNTRNNHPCERCGATTGTELQHWAPQAVFSDADQWPKSWLCPDCHRTWHDAMRAARGVSLPREQRARIDTLSPHLSRIAWGNGS